MQDLLKERRVSNKIIDEAMFDARKLSAQALDMLSDTNSKYAKVEERIVDERTRASTKIREERAHHSRSLQKLKISKLDADLKYEKVQNKMIAVKEKMKEQRLIWQRRFAKLESSSKKRLHKEREQRCNAVQQQVSKTSAMEDQLLEIIDGLEDMNYKLVYEVKSAKKGMRAAMKLYDKSKAASEKRLQKLETEKLEKMELKDDLSRALKAFASQQKLL
jgi:hypothetical protein